MNSLLVFWSCSLIHIFLWRHRSLFVALGRDAALRKAGGLWPRIAGAYMVFGRSIAAVICGGDVAVVRSGLLCSWSPSLASGLAFTALSRVLPRQKHRNNAPAKRTDGGFYHAPWRSGLSRLRRLV